MHDYPICQVLALIYAKSVKETRHFRICPYKYLLFDRASKLDDAGMVLILTNCFVFLKMVVLHIVIFDAIVLMYQRGSHPCLLLDIPYKLALSLKH